MMDNTGSAKNSQGTKRDREESSGGKNAYKTKRENRDREEKRNMKKQKRSQFDTDVQLMHHLQEARKKERERSKRNQEFPKEAIITSSKQIDIASIQTELDDMDRKLRDPTYDNESSKYPPALALDDSRIPKHFAEFFAKSNSEALQALKLRNVQQISWPVLLSGRDVLIVSPTGSGKTLAYSLPLIPIIKNRTSKVPSIAALILVPTRELAQQVSSVCKPMERLFGLKHACLHGGRNIAEDEDAMHLAQTQLDFCHFVIATPGRVLELCELGALNLASVGYFVLDEADRMFAVGIDEQVEKITSKYLPKQKQVVLVSATCPKSIRPMMLTWTKDLVVLRSMESQHTDSAKKPIPQIEASKIGSDEATNKHEGVDQIAIPDTIQQILHVCAEHKKPRKLIRFLLSIQKEDFDQKKRRPRSVLVFCNKVKTVLYVNEFLVKNGVVRCACLHGHMQQKDREKALSDFRAAKHLVLVATDVAARGLHIKGLSVVVNYDFPGSLEQYAHRAGRTGRDDENGISFSFFTRKLAPMARDLIGLLERHGQVVDSELRKLVEGSGPTRSDSSKDSNDDSDDGKDEADDDDGSISDDSSVDFKPITGGGKLLPPID